ncbi:hypothetical protein [Streptomyces glaucescens]|uniref:hypothetical protein n=1 Tax=Streptomyces glaucescens TaxID=1907 RepID=UPI00117F9F26|nr:hypothetical protein [Streptomyces glaucescens]
MRSISSPRSVLVAALGCLVLSACGTQQAASDRAAPAGSAVKATTSPKAPQSAEDQEVRFIGLVGQAIDACSPDAPSDKGDKGGEGVPVPEGLVLEEEPTPRYGPGETPPAVPGDAEEAPVPLPSDAPEPPSPATGSAKPKPPAEVPLPGTEKCYGDWHADRVVEAFKNTKATGYDAMRTKLTALDYPAARVHRMPDHGGQFRARVDLRFMGGHAALEVTGTGSGVIVEVFGAPETEDVKLTDVKRKPRLDTTM